MKKMIVKIAEKAMDNKAAYISLVIICACILCAINTGINTLIVYGIWNKLIASAFDVKLLTWTQCVVIGFIMALISNGRSKTANKE